MPADPDHRANRGFRIAPVNPTADEILGEKAYPSLVAIPFRVDIVDEAIRIGARALWLQFGVVHPAAARRAQEAGLAVVMDRCIKIEHMQREA